MNIKNSKFLKRIQLLRRISRDKIRKERERAKVVYQLESALNEKNGSYDDDGEKTPTVNKNKERSLSTNDIHNNKNGQDIATNGLIHIQNICYRLACPPKSVTPKCIDSPSISGARASICVSNSRYSIIGKVSKVLGYRVVKESKLWNILWTDSLPGVELYKNMKRFQQINHFPGMMEICRKDLLSRNLNRMLKLYPRDYKIFPKTWIFPADYGEALKYASNHFKHKPRTFIIKPDSGAQGRGIWLTNDLKTINPTDRMICQTYVSRPLLIDGYKFDLRAYILITSVDPLRIFVYNEGLARFATNKYVEPTGANNSDLFMHLTNYSVNKRSSQYDICDNDDCGSKRTFSAVNNFMRRNNHNVDEFWDKIDDIIIKTVLSAWPMLKHNYHACFPSHDKIQACFEVLGFDILVDSKLKPYILEVNHSPSFHTHEEVDRQVKKALIRDTLRLVSTTLADKKQILREDRKRVKQRLLKTKQGDISHRSVNTGTGSTNNQKNQSQNQLQHQVKSKYAEASGCPLSPLAQQVAWEESHLGDFRRIMPPHDSERLKYYCQFFAVQNQASIYAETAASKKREDLAKKMRLELEEKRKKQSELFNKVGRIKFEDRRMKRATVPRSVAEKQRQQLYKMHAHWAPGFISDAEERLRRTWLQMRTEMLRDKKIVQVIYLNLYNTGNLSHSDIANYPHLHQSLENGSDILA